MSDNPSGWQQRIAALRPWTFTSGGDVYCYFCGEFPDSKTHKANCLWQNAKDALPPSSSESANAIALANEVKGAFGIADAQIREAIGDTNANCMLRRADAVLDALPPAPEASRKPFKLDVSKEWCERMAQLEDGHDVSAGGDPIAAAVDAQLDPLKDELKAIGHKLAKELGPECVECGGFYPYHTRRGCEGRHVGPLKPVAEVDASPKEPRNGQ